MDGTNPAFHHAKRDLASATYFHAVTPMQNSCGADTRGLTELDLRHTEFNLNLSLHRTDDLAPSSRLPRHWSFQEISHTPDRLGEFGPSSAAVSPSERDRKSRSEVSTTWTEWSEREARARGESERREPEEGGAIEETLKV